MKVRGSHEQNHLVAGLTALPGLRDVRMLTKSESDDTKLAVYLSR